MKKLLNGLSLLLAMVGIAGAANSVTLAWNPNSETNLAGYRLYWGTATRVYSGTNTVGTTIITNVVGTNVIRSVQNVVSNLVVGRRYYFAVTAFTEDGLESDYSNEVDYGFRPGAPTMLRMTGSTNQTAAIWIDSVNIQTTVEWSPDMQSWKGWAQVKTLDASAPVKDAIFLTGVSPDTARFWRAVGDSTPVTLPTEPLPTGLRLSPRLPPLPSANP